MTEAEVRELGQFCRRAENPSRQSLSGATGGSEGATGGEPILATVGSSTGGLWSETEASAED